MFFQFDKRISSNYNPTAPIPNAPENVTKHDLYELFIKYWPVIQTEISKILSNTTNAQSRINISPFNDGKMYELYTRHWEDFDFNETLFDFPDVNSAEKKTDRHSPGESLFSRANKSSS